MISAVTHSKVVDVLEYEILKFLFQCCNVAQTCSCIMSQVNSQCSFEVFSAALHNLEECGFIENQPVEAVPRYRITKKGRGQEKR